MHFFTCISSGAELGFSDRGCKLLVNCISANEKPPFSWFQVKSFQKTAGANAPAALTLIAPLGGEFIHNFWRISKDFIEYTEPNKEIPLCDFMK